MGYCLQVPHLVNFSPQIAVCLLQMDGSTNGICFCKSPNLNFARVCFAPQYSIPFLNIQVLADLESIGRYVHDTRKPILASPSAGTFSLNENFLFKKKNNSETSKIKFIFKLNHLFRLMLFIYKDRNYVCNLYQKKTDRALI